MTKHEQTTIESILRSKRVPRISFSEAERATIVREQEKLLDCRTPGADEEFARELKPLLNLIENGDDSGFKKMMEHFVETMRMGAVDASFLSSRETPMVPLRHRHDCTASWTMSPPYHDADGGPVGAYEEEPAIQGGGPHLPLVIRTARAFPEEGRLSVGAANGKLNAFGLIEYPASGSWLFGDYNSAEAGIFLPVSFPQGALARPETIEVSVCAGSDSRYLANVAVFNPGLEGSTGDGLVAVLGKMYLTVYGNTVFHGFASRTEKVTFVRAWRSHSGDSGKVGTTIYEKDFSVSTTLSLKAGESNVFVVIAAKVWALRVGTKDEPFSFVAVNFTDDGASQLYPSNDGPPGTPIQIREINVALCPFILKPVGVVTA